ADFVQLPTVSKAETRGVPDQDLIDNTVPSPAGVALLGRSFGTTGEPVVWPVDWNGYHLGRASMKALLRRVHGDRRRTAVLLMMALDRGDTAANGISRSLFGLKEQTRWPFELFVTGEDPEVEISILRWIVKQGYESLLALSFAGTFERLLDHTAELERADPQAGINWAQFQHKCIMLTGQIIHSHLRERVRREVGLDPNILTSEEIILGSADTGQIYARTTPFTLWLERYLQHHPDLYDKLGWAEEHRTKALLEFVPPNNVFLEQDEEEGLVLTMW